MLTTDKKRQLYGVLVGMLLLGMILAACGGGATQTPAISVCPEPPTSTPTETLTPVPPTATPVPTETLLPDWLQPVNDASVLDTHYSNLIFLDKWLQENRLWLQANGYPVDLTYWQNYYNQDVLRYATENGIPPFLLKGLILKESHSALTPSSFDATGLAQITLDGFDQAFRYNPNSSNYIQLAYQYALRSGTAGGSNFPAYDSAKYPTYQDYYLNALDESQKAVLRNEAQKIVDGMCYPADVSTGQCGNGDLSKPLLKEGSASVDLAAQILAANKNQLITSIGQNTWNAIPPTEQWKMVVASYNGGVGCVSNSFHAAQSANAGQIQSWDQVKPYLENNCIAPKDTEVYSDIVTCYASGNGDTPCQ